MDGLNKRKISLWQNRGESSAFFLSTIRISSNARPIVAARLFHTRRAATRMASSENPFPLLVNHRQGGAVRGTGGIKSRSGDRASINHSTALKRMRLLHALIRFAIPRESRDRTCVILRNNNARETFPQIFNGCAITSPPALAFIRTRARSSLSQC